MLRRHYTGAHARPGQTFEVDVDHMARIRPVLSACQSKMGDREGITVFSEFFAISLPLLFNLSRVCVYRHT